jgi:hypothetical protein
MEPKDCFSLALRIVGFLSLAHGLRDLVDFALMHLNYTSTHSSFGYYLILGLLYSVAGVYLLRGAPLVVRFAYPTARADPSENDADN